MHRALALSLLAACGADPKADTASPTDTGPPGVYVACVSPITAPDQVALELTGWSPGNSAVLAADAALDPGCVATCADAAFCEEAACTTAAGVELTYKKTIDVIESTPSYDVQQTVLDATLSFTPDAALTSLTVHHERTTTSYNGADAGSDHTTSYEASWIGLLDPALPVDGTLSESETGYGDDCCWGVDRTYEINGCLTRYVDDAPAAYEVEYVERDGQTVVYWEPDAWLDGTCVGEVDHESFAVLGPCANPDDPPPTP
jgi:hypothetical protein